MVEPRKMARDVPFTYEYRACLRCYHDKLIQLSPCEISRLGRNRGPVPANLSHHISISMDLARVF